MIMFAYDAWGSNYKGSADSLANLLAVSQSVFYVSVIIMQFGNLMSVRNRSMSILESNPFMGPRKNLVLIGAMLVHVCIGLMHMYISTAPDNPNIFEFGSVPVQYWFIPIPLAFGLLAFDEVRKLVVRMYPKSFIAKVAR